MLLVVVRDPEQLRDRPCILIQKRGHQQDPSDFRLWLYSTHTRCGCLLQLGRSYGTRATLLSFGLLYQCSLDISHTSTIFTATAINNTRQQTQNNEGSTETNGQSTPIGGCRGTITCCSLNCKSRSRRRSVLIPSQYTSPNPHSYPLSASPSPFYNSCPSRCPHFQPL